MCHPIKILCNRGAAQKRSPREKNKPYLSRLEEACPDEPVAFPLHFCANGRVISSGAKFYLPNGKDVYLQTNAK